MRDLKSKQTLRNNIQTHGKTCAHTYITMNDENPRNNNQNNQTSCKKI